MSEELLLALDYGGTKLSAATARRGAREWLSLERSRSPAVKDARYEYDAMLALAQRLLGRRRPAAVGVSFGGPVDSARGRVILSHHVSGWEDMPLRERLQEALDAPVSVENDANVSALGEYSFGAGSLGERRASPLFYVTVSTGVGGGWVIDGKIFSGADHMAGEIGHTVAEPGGPPCVCGRRGCVECIACGPAIAREALALLRADPYAGAKLREQVGGNLDAITAERVAHAAQDGDEAARAVLDRAARALGFGIGTAITLANPERVIVGGGVTKSGDEYWSVLRAAARANTLPQIRADIVPAALGDDSPLWGAIALAESLPTPS